MTTPPANDEKYMQRALRLAIRGQGRVEPNPMVGCVIVKHGRVLGAGYHRRFGGPHAEIEALRNCSESPRGATVYVTLEPCCHHGKTPPCVDALLDAGVARVVAPHADPNPNVSGRGFATLRKHGMTIDIGPGAAPATQLNAPFFKLMRQQRPWLILKWAQSLDGKIATHTGNAKWISDEACRNHAHRVRARLDGIIVGVGTVLHDNPLLTARTERPKRIATRIVLDTKLRTPANCQLVQTAREIPTWIFHSATAPRRHATTLRTAGCVLHHIRQTKRGLSLTQVLDILGHHPMTNVLVEGGSALLGNFHDQQLADEYHIYVAPLLIGGTTAPGPLGARGARAVRNAQQLPPDNSVTRVGNGWFHQFRIPR